MEDKTKNAAGKLKDDSVWFFIKKALKRKRTRITLSFFILLMLIGSYFEAVGNSFWSDAFGAVGFSGAVLSMSIQLHFELPSPPFKNPDHITFHIINLIWIIGGLAFLFAFIFFFLK